MVVVRCLEAHNRDIWEFATNTVYTRRLFTICALVCGAFAGG